MDATIFATLGVNSGPSQVEIAKGERANSAFASHHGLFQFIFAYVVRNEKCFGHSSTCNERHVVYSTFAVSASLLERHCDILKKPEGTY